MIRALLTGCQRVLDLGCGERHHTKHLPDTVWVDLDPKHAKDSRVLIMDIREAAHAFRRMRFDAALLTDVLEHIPKNEGIQLLSQLEFISDRIIIFTPLGDLWVTDSESPHSHKSGWVPCDLPSYHNWVWNHFHRFKDGHTHGAFFAWKWTNGTTPSPEQISGLSNIPA